MTEISVRLKWSSLRDEADMVITNGPFSLFREFMAWIVEGRVQFSVIGSMNAITYLGVFPRIRDNLMRPGPTIPAETASSASLIVTHSKPLAGELTRRATSTSGSRVFGGLPTSIMGVAMNRSS